VSLFDISLHIK